MVSKQWTPSSSGANLGILPTSGFFDGGRDLLLVSLESLIFTAAICFDDCSWIWFLEGAGAKKLATVLTKESAQRESNELKIDMIAISNTDREGERERESSAQEIWRTLLCWGRVDAFSREGERFIEGNTRYLFLFLGKIKEISINNEYMIDALGKQPL